jgi:hypothetical protein
MNNEKTFEENVAELLTKGIQQYREYLKTDEHPIKITLELHPWEDGLQWTIRGHIPDGCKTNPSMILFTQFIKERIVEACKPPPGLFPEQVEITPTTRKETET